MKNPNLINQYQIMKNLDSIEKHTNQMAHEIPELQDHLKRYQDGLVNPIYFNEYLNKYIDKLNGEDRDPMGIPFRRTK
jgi:hypothetical protein